MSYLNVVSGPSKWPPSFSTPTAKPGPMVLPRAATVVPSPIPMAVALPPSGPPKWQLMNVAFGDPVTGADCARLGASAASESRGAARRLARLIAPQFFSGLLTALDSRAVRGEYSISDGVSPSRIMGCCTRAAVYDPPL